MANTLLLRLLGAVGIGLVTSVLSYVYIKLKSKIEQIPSKWKQIGILDEVHFYPIKSCAPIELNEALCENLGIQEGDVKDRALMVIESESGKLVTARTYPKMVQIVSKILSVNQIVISAPGMVDLNLDYSKIGDNLTKATIHGQCVDVKECGSECNTWFSTFVLGKPEGLQLVYYPYVDPTRPIAKEFQNNIFSKMDTGTFQDVSSYLLINNASVKDLNSRLTKDIFARQFRSNFYINSDLAYGEDDWQWIRIGKDAIFRNIAPCCRCILPNINPFTAQRDPDRQPLKTLEKYRMKPNTPLNSPVMGIQMGLRASGVVKKGDPVYVEDLTE